jgi:hypothetical protein
MYQGGGIQHYEYTSDDGKTVGMSPELYERYRNNPLFSRKLSAMKPVERVINPEYNGFIEGLRYMYPHRNTGQNWISFQDSLPEGYSIDETGFIYSPDGNVYVDNTFKGSGRYSVDKVNPKVF